MSKTRSYQWYPGDMYNSLYGDVQIHSYYFSDKPVRPKGKEHDSYMELTRQTREKAAKQALILIRLQFDRIAKKVTYSCQDLRKNQVYGDYTTSTEGKTDQELTERLKDKALNKVFSPMELLTLSMKSTKSNPFQLKFGYPKSIYAGFTHEAEHQRRTIAITLEPYWPTPDKRMFSLRVLRVIGPAPDYIYTHGPTGGRFHSEQEAFDFVSDWYAEKFLSPMEMLATGLSDDNDKAKSNPERLLHWALDGGTSRIDFYRSWYKGKTIVVGVEGRARPVPHHITSFLVIPDERSLDGRRQVSHQGPIRTQEFKDPQEALDFAEQWFIDTCLSPMELMSLAMKAKENPQVYWEELASNPYDVALWTKARRNPELNWEIHGGDWQTDLHLATYKQLRLEVSLKKQPVQIVRAHVVDTMSWTIKAAYPDKTAHFFTVKDALNAVEQWFFDHFVSPMALLGRAMSKPNPSFRLPFKKGAYAFYFETKHKNNWISAWVEAQPPSFKLHRSEVITFSSDGQRCVTQEGPADMKFPTREAALDHVSNWYADTYLSPMDLLGLGLTAKENPRNPQLPWAKTDEVHLHGSDDISRLIVYETRYDQTRWLRIDLSEHTENDTPYYLVDDAYVETPEGTIWLGREFKAAFDTEEEALEHFENYFFTHFTTPMEMLSRSLKANPRRKYTDVKGRSIPARYLKGLPKDLQERRIKELGRSRDAYKLGDYSELPTDKAARKLGLVKKSAYSEVAEERGIEWRGNAYDMARRVFRYYKSRTSDDKVEAFADALTSAYNKGLAAWKSGGHRPGATAKNWAVARVASLVVGGKTAWTADRKEFAVLPEAIRKKIIAQFDDVADALRDQGRYEDVEAIRKAVTKGKARHNPHVFDGAATVVKDKKGRILLLRRSSTDPWKPGFWNLPGGRIEPKEKPVQSAARELTEETGLTVSKLFDVGTVDSGEGWIVHVFVAQPSDWEGRVRMDSENDAYVWVTKDEAKKLPLIPTVAETLNRV